MPVKSSSDLQNYYCRMWENALLKFEKGEFEYDASIDSQNDTRKGIILVAHPPANIRTSILNMLDAFKIIEPHQYYYPEPDLHITVYSIVTCFEGFVPAQALINSYIDVVNHVLKNCRPFRVKFEGITASPGCVLIQGYPMDEELLRIRESLQHYFNLSELFNQPDTRHQIQTAHSTVIRLKNELTQPKVYIGKIQQYRTYDFGTFECKELELIHNDWYHRREFTQVLERIKIGSQDF